MIMTNIPVERNAYNKAGSILLNLINLIEIKDHIPEREKEDGSIFNESYHYAKDNDKIAADIIIMCLRAGSLSEKYYCWLKGINYDDAISGNDLWQISRISYAGKNESVRFEDHLKGLEYKTQKIILNHWRFVITLARRLLGKEYLPVSEIYELWAIYSSDKQ